MWARDVLAWKPAPVNGVLMKNIRRARWPLYMSAHFLPGTLGATARNGQEWDNLLSDPPRCFGNPDFIKWIRLPEYRSTAQGPVTPNQTLDHRYTTTVSLSYLVCDASLSNV